MKSQYEANFGKLEKHIDIGNTEDQTLKNQKIYQILHDEPRS
jgi:hypothetical protein